MFQFRRFPSYTYFVQCRMTGYCPAGLPHSEISGSQDICSSPKLFAACHVLHRLLMPRHSPCALFSLTNRKQFHLFSFVNYAGLQRLEIVIIVTLHPFGCCSTIIFRLPCSRMAPLCCLTSHFVFRCSVFKVQSLILRSDLKIQSLGSSNPTAIGGPEWARTTDLAIISRTL